mgnify:CR=1 FL=1
MADALITSYQCQKITTVKENISEQNQSIFDDFLEDIDNITKKHIESIDKTLKNSKLNDKDSYFGEWAMDFKQKIRDLKSEIFALRNKEIRLQQEAVNSFEQAIDENKTRSNRANLLFNGTSKTTEYKDVKKLCEKKSSIKENLNKEYDALINEIKQKITKMKNKIKEYNVKMNRDFTKLDKFCEYCNELGGKYCRQKNVNFLSTTSNKMKKEVARILSVLKSPVENTNNTI